MTLVPSHTRYWILNPRIFSKSKFVSSRKATEEVLDFLEIDHPHYQCGVTKVTQNVQEGIWREVGGNVEYFKI
jgi:hypothetical protein